MSVQKRTDAGRTTWRARYRDASGKEHSRNFTRKIDAQRWLDGITADVMTGTYVHPDRGQMTVGEFGRLWLDAQRHLKASTRFRYANMLRLHVLPTWEAVPLADVTHVAVVTWTGRLQETLAGATVRQAHRVLSMILTLAVKDNRVYRNHAAGVPLPRAAAKTKRFLTHQQVSDLAHAVETPTLKPARKHGKSGRRGEQSHDGLVILVLAYTGIRFGELVALKVGSVDLMRRRLSITESASEVGSDLIFSDPKSHQARSVPLPRFLVDPLALAMAGKAPGDLVFTAPSGGPLRLSNYRQRVFTPAARAAGLDGLTPHDLRHTAASLAVAAGANVKAVQRMLGHASAAMTLDVYSGLFDDDLDAVADRMDDSRESLAAVLRPFAKIIPLPRSSDVL